jgi:PKD repeat protein
MNARPWLTRFGLLLVLGFVVALCWFSAPDVNAAPAFQSPLPQPVVSINAYPYQPSTLTDISFYAQAYDPYTYYSLWITEAQWDFGDGSTSNLVYTSHRYAKEGTYTVNVTVTIDDGRRGTASMQLVVENHDVAITKISVPNSARAGQTRQISVGISSKLRGETVTVAVSKSVTNPYYPYEQFGSLTQFVAARSSNRTTEFAFNYTFTPADAALGKVTFKAEAYISGYTDMLQGDNTVISLPTKVSGGSIKAAGVAGEEEEENSSFLFLPAVSGQ